MAAVALNMTIPVIVKNNGEVRGGNKNRAGRTGQETVEIKNLFCRVS